MIIAWMRDGELFEIRVRWAILLLLWLSAGKCQNPAIKSNQDVAIIVKKKTQAEVQVRGIAARFVF